MKNSITAGELARLAGTTKRTILFYHQKGVLEPSKTADNGYRYYQESQVLDFQKIRLLTTLGLSLEEISTYLKDNGTLDQLFDTKKTQIKKEIKKLEFDLNNLQNFSSNLSSNGTMIKPKIKTLKSFDIYYINKIGPYVRIAEYCQELEDMFADHGKNFTTLSIFEDQTYRPKKSHIKIGVIAQKNMKVNRNCLHKVKRMTFNPGKVITYTHNGTGDLLSLFWKELEKYCRLHHINPRENEPDFEIYRQVNTDPSKQFFEIYIPIQ